MKILSTTKNEVMDKFSGTVNFSFEMRFLFFALAFEVTSQYVC